MENNTLLKFFKIKSLSLFCLAAINTPLYSQSEIQSQKKNLVTAEQANVPATQDKKIRIRDSHGKWAFDAPPKRIAVINWTATEQLIELGINPVAIADIKGFKTISPQTQFSTEQSQAIDLGSRFTPNLNKLKQAKPDLILIGYSQRDLLRPLSNIASVMYFNNFSRRNNNAEKADERFLILAKLFNKNEFAQNKLKQRDKKIAELKQSLTTQLNNKQTAFTVASLKQNDLWAYSNNSLPEAVITKLGLSTELNDKPTKLGTRKLKKQEINNLNGCLILINNSLDASTENIPKTKNNCFYSANTTNTFGGAMSQLHLAQSITDSLLK